MRYDVSSSGCLFFRVCEFSFSDIAATSARARAPMRTTKKERGTLCCVPFGREPMNKRDEKAVEKQKCPTNRVTENDNNRPDKTDQTVFFFF